MNNDDMVQMLEAEWDEWPDTKDKVAHFDFRDFVKATYGIEYSATRLPFKYKIVDEKKFMFFLLKRGGSTE